ncbi:MAG: phosphatidylglycerol lysyltransferase domain-containing protein [Gammaproteobacteria bacterium]
MSGQLEGNQVNDLLQHLEAQRQCALELITRHNRLLTTMMGQSGAPVVVNQSQTARPLTSPMVSPSPEIGAAKGNVVSLFDYSSSETKETISGNATSDFIVFDEFDAQARDKWGEDVDALLKHYGADDALAVNRKQMAGTIFLAESKKGLFFFKSHSGVMFVVCFVGADDGYAQTLNELKGYAKENDLLINLMAQENRVEVLKDNGFSTTPMGIWQQIYPLSEFTLKGSSMRRLRYLVSKYTKLGACKTVEYMPGSDVVTDKEICRVIDQWVELKGQNPPFIADVKQQVMEGKFGKDHRFFLTYREQQLDNVMVFSRDNFNDGYLMDLEFYPEGLPLGSTEFALCEIISAFRDEGRKQVSLGLTMGTELFEHENRSKDVHNLFEQLKKADMLNGDANAQYKNKYRPTTNTMYLARPKGSGKSKLNDLMMLLGSG